MLRTTTLLALLHSCQAVIYPQHYPPSDSPYGDLDTVFNPERGTNGGVYSTSNSPEYGAYNFCNMPHVRSPEYKKPEGFELQYVEVVHRHHKRTPYASNVFPKEDIGLSCDRVTNFYYGQAVAHNYSAQIGWDAYVDPENPFAHQYGFNGSCQFPEISEGGLEDSRQHGIDIFQNYHGKLGFLPDEFDPKKIKFQVTNNQITSQVAGALIGGMYPDLEQQSVDVSIQRADSDYLEPKYSCIGADKTKKFILSSEGWNEHLERSEYLFNELDAISGVNPDNKGWHVSWDHYFDNLAHRLCHGLPLPCKIDDPSTCITEKQAEQVFRLGDHEYNYQYREAPQSTLYSVAKYGIFLQKVLQHLNEAASGSSEVIYRHNIAHDGSISPLLGALQIDYLRWPGMGAEVVFELWKKEGQDFVRVLYGGQPLVTSTPLGTLDLVPLEEFANYLESFLKENNVYELCQ
ncbi:hypothetical protein FT663_02190 [Candidozyma haemuli var. vulneris]|nr:hypothetical protein FT662_02389 [[Candida] haemuloni var. vulneris]KAF3992677.1 hypothetical protein FT663_02190 [[Candida] haemuloni var. vulneris]